MVILDERRLSAGFSLSSVQQSTRINFLFVAAAREMKMTQRMMTTSVACAEPAIFYSPAFSLSRSLALAFPFPLLFAHSSLAFRCRSRQQLLHTI